MTVGEERTPPSRKGCPAEAGFSAFSARSLKAKMAGIRFRPKYFGANRLYIGRRVFLWSASGCVLNHPVGSRRLCAQSAMWTQPVVFERSTKVCRPCAISRWAVRALNRGLFVRSMRWLSVQKPLPLIFRNVICTPAFRACLHAQPFGYALNLGMAYQRLFTQSKTCAPLQ